MAPHSLQTLGSGPAQPRALLDGAMISRELSGDHAR